jgi:hypothetical protein
LCFHSLFNSQLVALLVLHLAARIGVLMTPDIILPQTRHRSRERCEKLSLRFGHAPQWVRRVGMIIAACQPPINHRELTLRKGNKCIIKLRPAPVLAELAPGALFHAGREPSSLMRINFATTQNTQFWEVFGRLRVEQV